MSVSNSLGPAFFVWAALLAWACVMTSVAVQGEGHQQDVKHIEIDGHGIHSSHSPVKRSADQLAVLKTAILKALGPEVANSLSDMRPDSEDYDAGVKQGEAMSSGPESFESVDENLDDAQDSINDNSEPSVSELDRGRLTKDELRLVDLALERIAKRLNGRAHNVPGKNWMKKRQSFRPWQARKRFDDGTDDTTTLLANRGSNNRARGDAAKRNGEDNFDQRELSKVVAKRPAFCSWCGKRSNKRSYFNPWHGKRSRPDAFNNAQKDLPRAVIKSSSFDQLDLSAPSLEGGKYRTDVYPHLSPSRSDLEESEEDNDILLILDGLENLAVETRNSDSSFSNNDKRYEEGVKFTNFDKRQAFSPWNGKRSVLDNVEFDDKSLRSALKSQEKQKVLRRLRELYRRIVDRRTAGNRNEDSVSSENDDENQSVEPYEADLKDDRATQKENSVISYAKLHRKRPSFHSWAGKRDAPSHSIRHKRSSNESETLTTKLQSVETSKSGDSSFYSSLKNKTMKDTDKSLKLDEHGSFPKNKEQRNKEKRRGFSAWHGKRSSLQGDMGTSLNSVALEKSVKRLVGVKRSMGFSAWQGKRHFQPPKPDVVDSNNEPLNVAEEMGPKGDNKDAKRSRGFSAWHGKRASVEKNNNQIAVSKVHSPDIAELDSPKQEVTASSGTQKPSTSNLQKRPAFSSWHGKRTSDKIDKNQVAFSKVNNPKTEEPDSSKLETSNQAGAHQTSTGILHKRPAFSSWHGKRTSDEIDKNQITDSKLNSHGTKEPNSPKSNQANSHQSSEGTLQKRPAFSSWHGKRAPNIETTSLNSPTLDTSSDQVNTQQTSIASFQKRPAFSSWHGKRTPNGDYKHPITGSKTPTPTSKFASPSLKTSNDQASDPITSIGSLQKRPAFSSWHGKRADSGKPSKTPFIVSVEDSGKSGASQRNLKDLNQKYVLVPLQDNIKDSEQALGGDNSVPELKSRKRGLNKVINTRVKGHRSQRSSLERFHAWSGKRSGWQQNSGLILLPVDTEMPKQQQFSNLQPNEQSQGNIHMPTFVYHPLKDREETLSGFADVDLNAPTELVEVGDYETSDLDNKLGTPIFLKAKRASFSAWHGKKRSEVETGVESPPYQVIKRPAFHAWSGKKRNYNENFVGQQAVKRPAFQPWGGKKRSQLNFASFQAPPPLQKRPHFQAWYGRRRKRGDTNALSPIILDSNSQPVYPHRLAPQDSNIYSKGSTADDQLHTEVPSYKISPSSPSLSKRPAFHAWSGKKRFSDSLTLNLSPSIPSSLSSFPQPQGIVGQAKVFSTPVKRQAFHAWNGKRQAFHAWNGKRDISSFVPMKRQAFHAWNGKRDISSFVPMKRQAFHAWNGKRQAFHAWNGKRDSRNIVQMKRQAFHAWNGKRQAFNAWNGKRDSRNIVQMKRQAFHAWNGKRGSNSLVETSPKQSIPQLSGNNT